MSKEQAIRFMLLTKEDKDLKQKYQGIVNKYEGKNLTKEEQEKIILEEVIPLAKSKGYDFSLGDFQELLQSAKKQLTDEELEQTVGGRGRFTDHKYVYTCELVTGDTTFFMYLFNRISGCANYEWNKSASNTGSCFDCMHLKKTESPYNMNTGQ